VSRNGKTQADQSDQNTDSWVNRAVEPGSIALSFIVSYLVATSKSLESYSLQVAAGLFLLYFIGKKLQHSKWNRLMPKEESIETAVLLVAVCVVIGSSGGLASPFMPLFILLLFISVLTIRLTSNLVVMGGMMIFLWAVSRHPLDMNQLLALLTLPLIFPLMLFARWQFESAQENRWRLRLEEELLSSQESHMLMFLSTYLIPLLKQLRAMLVISEQNRLSVAKQLEILEQEANRVVKDIDQADD